MERLKMKKRTHFMTPHETAYLPAAQHGTPTAARSAPFPEMALHTPLCRLNHKRTAGLFQTCHSTATFIAPLFNVGISYAGQAPVSIMLPFASYMVNSPLPSAFQFEPNRTTLSR